MISQGAIISFWKIVALKAYWCVYIYIYNTDTLLQSHFWMTIYYEFRALITWIILFIHCLFAILYGPGHKSFQYRDKNNLQLYTHKWYDRTVAIMIIRTYLREKTWYRCIVSQQVSNGMLGLHAVRRGPKGSLKQGEGEGVITILLPSTTAKYVSHKIWIFGCSFEVAIKKKRVSISKLSRFSLSFTLREDWMFLFFYDCGFCGGQLLVGVGWPYKLNTKARKEEL